MTTEEIVKALRKNADENTCRFACEECDEADCLTPVFRAAAALIEQQAAKNAALKFQLKHLKSQRQHDDENYIMAESVNNILPMGFYKGRVQVEEQVIDWLERMVMDG